MVALVFFCFVLFSDTPGVLSFYSQWFPVSRRGPRCVFIEGVVVAVMRNHSSGGGGGSGFFYFLLSSFLFLFFSTRSCSYSWISRLQSRV